MTFCCANQIKEACNSNDIKKFIVHMWKWALHFLGFRVFAESTIYGFYICGLNPWVSGTCAPPCPPPPHIRKSIPHHAVDK